MVMKNSTIIRRYKETYRSDWDNFVNGHPNSIIYHLAGWKNVIEQTYGHKTYYLMAFDSKNVVKGILPLVYLKHFIFGSHLVSIPFADMGGVLADDRYTEKKLLDEMVEIGRELKVQTIELRQSNSMVSLMENEWPKDIYGNEIKGQKVRMVLELPESSDLLMKSFNSKFRNKIKKPIKAGLVSRIGGSELLNDFYSVFAENMRDLGSPVHSKQMIENVLKEFPDRSRIGIVYKDKNPIAGIFVIGFKNMLANPWASALRKYGNLRANTLQYWIMLKYACDNGFDYFDFGRSTPGEGTYKFKEKWGAEPHPLHWYSLSMKGRTVSETGSEKSKFGGAIKIWKRLPVDVTKIIGPSIRKNISL